MKCGFHLGSPFNYEVCHLNKSYQSLYHQIYYEEPGVPVSKAIPVIVEDVVVLLTNMVFRRLRLHIMMVYNCSLVAAVNRVRL